jgi:DNA-binding MarR family transcriptional regulator
MMAFDLPPREALSLWHDVALELVQDGEFDFSLRQLTILFTIYLEDQPHTVRGLASKLKVTKPVITRALDTMGQRDLLKRRRDDNDRRNVMIERTENGAALVEKIGMLISTRAKGTGHGV